MKNKLLLLIVLLGIGAGGSIGFIMTHTHTPTVKTLSSRQSAVPKQAVTVVPSISPGVPETISIPKINVHADVESVGMDSQGRMDVPKNGEDTAWYSPGYKPGMRGSAVIDGHLDLVTGAPAVFWNLQELTPGDTISVTDNNGSKYTFAVDHLEKYPYNTFPMKEVFADSKTPMLNLITCNGVWDQASRNYSDRLVVYSKLVSED